MFKGKIKIFVFISLILVTIFSITIEAKYITNNRDTLTNTSRMEFEEIDLTDDYSFLYETEYLEFYYRSKTDCFVIKDKRNGYSWKTGIDALTSKELIKNYENKLLEELLMYDSLTPEEEERITKEFMEKYLTPAPTMTDTYVYRANSAISVEYINEKNNTFYASTNNPKVNVKYAKDKKDKSIFKFTYDFSKIIDLQLEVIYDFGDKGINVSILDETITGEGQASLMAIEVFPFLGAVGGEFIPYDFDEPMWEYDNEDLTFKAELIDGYSVIPDGSGALVRFRANTQKFTTIDLPVYGHNFAVNQREYSREDNWLKDAVASLPMFGMVHGFEQNAFLAYASEGEMFMHILSVPYAQNNVYYNWTYGKFFYNQLYFQVYNDTGAGNYSIMSERNHFNISMNYEFLCGDGSEDGLKADYIGIAEAYKKVVKDSLSVNKQETNDIPIRIDFIMADSEPAIIGFNDVVMTTTDDVDAILQDFVDNGILNVNAGLYGYDDGGITIHKLDKLKFNNDIGSKSDYKKLISKYKDMGIDISLVDNYLYINNAAYNLAGKAAKHYNGQYCVFYNWTGGNEDILSQAYLRSDVALKYSTKKFNKINKKLDPMSQTINGISNNFISHYKGSIVDAMDDYISIFENASSNGIVNAERPNSYLWPYITRYLGAKAFNSQFTIETDSVPLISYILNDYMEMYAEYSNFSFYDTESILRMIDYNLSPSFVLTKESSHLLINTNSNNYYSTEYDIYKDTILEVYDGVNGALSHVYNANWIDRNVLANGVIINEYSNGKSIIINYTDEDYAYNDTVVKSMSYEVIS